MMGRKMDGSATIREKKFVHHYIASGSSSKAFVEAYNPKSVIMRTRLAKKAGYELLQRKPVQDYLREKLENIGLTDSKIGISLKKILVAGTSPDALRFANPAHALKAVSEINRMKDNYPATKTQVEQKSASVSLNLQGKSPDELQGVLDNLLEEVRQFKQLTSKVNEAEVL